MKVSPNRSISRSFISVYCLLSMYIYLSLSLSLLVLCHIDLKFYQLRVIFVLNLTYSKALRLCHPLPNDVSFIIHLSLFHLCIYSTYSEAIIRNENENDLFAVKWILLPFICISFTLFLRLWLLLINFILRLEFVSQIDMKSILFTCVCVCVYCISIVRK